jgi:hypothetical protein
MASLQAKRCDAMQKANHWLLSEAQILALINVIK